MIRILKINSVLVLLVVVLFSIIILGTTVFAAEPSGTGDPPSTGGAATTVTYESPIKATNFPALLTTILETLVYLGVSVLTIFIIYSGFLFIKAQGNPEEIKKARETLTWTLIGGAILLGATVLAKIIETTVKSLE